MRRTVRKEIKGEELQVERRSLKKEEALILDRSLCIGCGFCTDVCPKEALTLSSASISEGRLIKQGEVDVDEGRCIFCGICVALCPTRALRLMVEGRESTPLLEEELFPIPTRKIEVDEARCKIGCGLKCQEACPTDAIKVVVESTPDKGEQITGVKVDEAFCLYCERCEVACPLSLIQVRKPFSGTIKIRKDLCQENCRVCADICPSQAIELDNKGKPMEFPEFCVFCTACKKVCPKGAIEIEISDLSGSEVKSGVWFAVLEKMTSKGVLARELAGVSERKRRALVKERLP
jgi:4Fe-4S ferredoxin